ILPTFRWWQYFANLLCLEHEELRADIHVSLRVICHILAGPHLSFVAYDMGPYSRSYHHGNFGLGLHAQFLNLANNTLLVLQFHGCEAAGDFDYIELQCLAFFEIPVDDI